MIRIVLAAALATALCAVAIEAPVSAAKFPEYDKVWEDGKLRKPPKKGLKAKTTGSKERHKKPAR